MNLNVEKELAALNRMSVGALRERYAEVCRETTNARHKQWLVKRIIWRMQAIAEGDLTERARQRAAELANGADLRRKAPKSQPTGPDAATQTRMHRLPPKGDRRIPIRGSLITRYYKGQALEVKVLADGFEYEGETCKSLITVPKFAFSITRRINTAAMTIGYLQNVFTLSGRVNESAWSITMEGIEFNFQAGEVLFLGASGRIVRQDSDDDQETLWELEYGFEASPNATGLRVGDISGIDKDGWDYLWVRWEDAEDEDAAMMVKRPRSAHVERVYFRGDFADLEL